MTVLIIEDDDEVRGSLWRALLLDGWEVLLAADGREGLAAARAGAPDVIVLDVALPDIDGITVARALRETGDRTPILMLTARVAVRDRIAGLDAGADDYMLKPYDVGELRARLRALTRRETRDSVLVHGFADLKLDLQMQAARFGDRTIPLTPTEVRLLDLFLAHPRCVLGNEAIHRRLWDQEFAPGPNALRVCVANLRRKLETNGARRLIHTVHGVGYVMREP